MLRALLRVRQGKRRLQSIVWTKVGTVVFTKGWWLGIARWGVWRREATHRDMSTAPNQIAELDNTTLQDYLISVHMRAEILVALPTTCGRKQNTNKQTKAKTKQIKVNPTCALPMKNNASVPCLKSSIS